MVDSRTDEHIEAAGGDTGGTTGGGPVGGDRLVTSVHTVETKTGTLNYTATAGTLSVREEALRDGVSVGAEPKADVFIVSYVLEDTESSTRPVTYVFNGGPGSPSLWLHLGLFGPRKVVAGDVDGREPPPYGLTDNVETLLADSDLVFIDPMTTGFSRPVEGTDPGKYHGFSGDRDLVGEVIRLWTTRNERWLSPKFLAGESYGTTRAAALAGHMAERHGMAFNGIVLLSSVLDMGSSHFSEGNDAPYIHYLPTYAAIAWYHGKHGDRSLSEVVADAEDFAAHDYTIALAGGSRLGEDDRQAAADRLSELIGIDVDYIVRADLRVEHQRFFAELLRARGLAVGRLDGRFTAAPGDLNRAEIDVDPSYRVIQFPYTAAANHYFRAELRYETDLPYEILTDRVHPWSYSEFENRSVTSAEDLASAMRSNPDLKVYVAFGYYDGATPFAAAEHVFAHLRIPEHLRANITKEYYEAGHMMYVHEPSRVAQSRHIADFIGSAVPPPH